METETPISSMARIHRRVQTPVGERTRTKQSMAPACDINNIMKKFRVTGNFDHLSAAVAVYGDFSNVDEYHAAMNKVRTAEEHFATLSAAIRKACGNDPARLVELYTDMSPENTETLRQLGLFGREEEPSLETPAEPEKADEPTGEDPA